MVVGQVKWCKKNDFFFNKIKIFGWFKVKNPQHFFNRGGGGAGPGSAVVRTIFIGVFIFTHIKVEKLIHWTYNYAKTTTCLNLYTFIFIFYNRFFLYPEKTAHCQLITISLQIVALYSILRLLSRLKYLRW